MALNRKAPPLSVYYGYDPEVMRFRAGFPVQSGAAEHASSDVQYDETPSGQVLHFKHVGPYDQLRGAYGGLLQYAEAQGVKIGAPGWEFYLNDPATTAPEALVTEAYVAIESA